MELLFQSTASSITVYWEKPAHGTQDSSYTLFLNGKLSATVSRTHYTWEDLPSNTSFFAEVKMGDTILCAANICTSSSLQRIDVTAEPYYAVGDGTTMNTAALQRAIDDCAADQELYFPKGVYMTGALRLHSDMAIYLDEGAVLQGTEEPKDYLPRIPSRFEGIHQECYSSLLNLGHLDHTAGPNCSNVLLYGKGTIASGGHNLDRNVTESERVRLKAYLVENADLVATCENSDTIPGRVRPRLINMSNCQNIRISGLTLKNGACWNVHMIYSDHIITDHCTFISEGVRNGDGWDPDSSTNCTLFACRFYTGDDSVAIKSGKNPEGNVIARPSKHIRVFDCFSAYGHGICMGSEMSGGIEDVAIWDCDLSNSLYGIEIKGTKKRGGYVRDIRVYDCTLPRVLLHSVGYNDDGIPAEHPPIFENCSFENLQITGLSQDMKKNTIAVTPIEVHGFDQPGYESKNIVFRGCNLVNGGEISLKHCRQITFEDMESNF